MEYKNHKVPMVSIVIPVYKDWQNLILCLEALIKQNYPKDFFEIIIANNEEVHQVPVGINLPNNAVIIHEVKPGSYAARNAALKLSKGEIIGFTDADCIPHNDWIKNAVIYLKNNPGCSRVAGKVNLFSKSTKPTVAEKYEMLYAFDQMRYVKYGTSVTANLFTYRYVFDKVGFFKDDIFSGGDYWWGILAEKGGFKIHYVDNVIVDHPARHRLSQLISKEKRVGAGQAFFLNSGGTKFTKLKNFFLTLKPKFFEYKVITQKGNHYSLAAKLKIFMIRHLLIAIRGYSKFKVEIGHIPNRKN